MNSDNWKFQLHRQKHSDPQTNRSEDVVAFAEVEDLEALGLNLLERGGNGSGSGKKRSRPKNWAPPQNGQFLLVVLYVGSQNNPKTGSLQRRHHIEATNCAARQTVSRRSLRQRGLGGCLVLWAAGSGVFFSLGRFVELLPLLSCARLFEKCHEPLFRVTSFTVIVTTWA